MLLAVALVVSLAAISRGITDREMDLNNAGVWVTSDRDGMWGRVNRSAGRVDAGLIDPLRDPGSVELDVLQDQEAVVGWTRSQSRLFPVDTRDTTGVGDGAVSLPMGGAVAMGGGVLADVSDTGEVRTTRYAPDAIPDLSGLGPDRAPLVTLNVPRKGAGAVAVAVDNNGVVFVASIAGDWALVEASGQVRTGSAGSGFGAVAVSLVGGVGVVADSTTGDVFFSTGAHFKVGARVTPQQPSVSGDKVVVATDGGLVSIGLSGGEPTSIYTISDPSGRLPAPPVVTRYATYGAWGGAPGRVVRLSSGVTTESVFPADGSFLYKPAFRVNRGSVLLNDMANGAVFDVDDQIGLDDWSSLNPPENDANDNELDPADKNLQVQDDHMWVRPGRQSVLHVLDNDENPGNGIVSITSVTGDDADNVVISPDGQTLLASVPPGQVKDMHVTYAVANQADATGLDKSGTGNVTISMRDPGENASPNLFGALGQEGTPSQNADQGGTGVDFTVASGGSLQVAPAWAWRDADCDPVQVVSASAGGRVLPVTAQGLIQYAAPATPAQTAEMVDYVVSDGLGQPVAGTFGVQILASGANQGVAPKAMSDSVRGVAGEPITFYPLDNDVPGADPVNKQAKLALPGPPASRVGVTVLDSDIASGQVSVVTDQAGVWFLDYTVSYGSQVAMGKIRVEALPADGLVAVPDAAVLRGTVPVIVDVLANDHDAYGSVLTVVSAAADDPGKVVVGVVDGRWLRVGMISSAVSPAPTRVTYTVVNGRGEQATSDLWLTQAPAVTTDQVSVVDDYATVRVGDVTVVPALANDSSTSGLPLVINDNVPGVPAGQLLVDDPSAPAGQAGDTGQAFADGDRIRYVAPTTGDEPRLLRIEYQAGVASGSPMTGYVWVSVVPEPPPADPGTVAPDPKTANRAPVPGIVEVRAMAGDTITIGMDTYNQDPDGDSVTVVGLASAPQAGRVVAVNANSLTYEAYPDLANPGTDTFQFYVRDRFGAVGVGTARVGLSPLGVRTAPMAVDDVVTAQPGAPVTVYPAANDVVSSGTRTLAVVLDSDAPGVTLDQPSRSVLLAAPAADDPAVSVSYHLYAGGVSGVSAQISVRGQAGYLNPPRVYDHVVTDVTGGVAHVDVLNNAWDVDGLADQIHLVSAGGGATISGGTLSIPVTGLGQVVPFVAEDATGARASAVVFVPGTTGGRPALVSGGLIRMDSNSSKTVALDDYIRSPRNQSVHLTMASHAWTSPAANLDLMVESDRKITLTAKNSYSGPAALTVEVRDSPNSDDVAAVTGVVTIPVQIGPPTPVLWCPPTTIEVVQGGTPKDLDIAGLCRVWSPTPDQQWRFGARWVSGGDGIQVTGRDGSALPSDWLSVRATESSAPGTSSVLEVSVAGFESVTARVTVVVIPAPKPVLRVASVSDVRQGTQVSVPVTVSSPMANGVQHIVSVTQTAGPAGAVTFDDRTIRVTPGGATHGVLSFDVVGSDVRDDARTDRQVRGSFTVTVYGVPDAPSPPQPGAGLRAGSAVVSFVPGADNGSPITSYELRWDGGSQSCGLNTTCEIPGLSNGTAYRFQARAINKAGPSGWSAPGPEVTPDALPGPVTGFAVTSEACNSVTLTWTGVSGGGSAVSSYFLTWTGQPAGTLVDGTEHSITVNALTNGSSYTFAIVAENQAGRGLIPVTVTAVPACQPLWPSPVAVTVTAADMGDTASVVVSWPAADPQGLAPVWYQVRRTDGDAVKMFAPTQSLSLSDTSVVYDGTWYTYEVVATNSSPGTRPSDTIADRWQAISAPAPWSTVGGPAAVIAGATGLDGQIKVGVARVPNYRDASGSVVVTVGGKKVVVQPGQDQMVGGFTNGTDVTASFQACNVSGRCNAAQPVSVAGGPFGGLSPPDIAVTNGTGRQVCFSAGGNGNGRGAILEVTSSGYPKAGQVYSSPVLSVNQCLDPGVWDTEITFTAALLTAVTDPSRGDAQTKSAGARTPVGVPDDFGPGDLNLEANGHNQSLDLTINKFPASNGGTLSAYYSVNGGSAVRIQGSPPVTVQVGAGPNGVESQVVVWATNGENSNTPRLLTATPYGPLDKPTMQEVTGSGTLACVQAETPANGTNGAPAALQIVVDRNVVWISPMMTGPISSGQQCWDTGGYRKTVTFTAALVTAPGLRRGNSEAFSYNATSPLAMPAALQASDVSWEATGVTNRAWLKVVNFPSLGLPDEVSYVVLGPLYSGGGTRWSKFSLTRSDPSYLHDSFPDGVPTAVTFTPCNTTACNDDGAITVYVTTYGPIEWYPASTWPDPGTVSTDKTVCATFAANSHGKDAEITVTNNYDAQIIRKLVDNESIQMCVKNAPAGATVTFMGDLVDKSDVNRTAPLPQYLPVTVPEDPPPPPPPPPNMSVVKGSGNCDDGLGAVSACTTLYFTLSGFQGQAQCTYSEGAITKTGLVYGNGTYQAGFRVDEGTLGIGAWTFSCLDFGTGRTTIVSGSW